MLLSFVLSFVVLYLFTNHHVGSLEDNYQFVQFGVFGSFFYHIRISIAIYLFVYVSSRYLKICSLTTSLGMTNLVSPLYVPSMVTMPK